jgi:hypothetical protein
MRCSLTLLGEGLQHVSRLGDLRQVDLRAELIRRARPTAGSGAMVKVTEVLTYLLCFVGFERAGVGLLLGDANLGQRFENLPALDFQFPSQIVNSRLHPTFISSVVCRSQAFIKSSRL